MARGRVVKSAIDAALSTVKSASKAADEVVESAGKSAGRASMIKNCVNSVQSNMSTGQAKAVANAGGDGARALKEGIDTALEQTKAKTAQKALDRTARQGNSAVQKSKEFIDAKRVNQVIDGHNAKQRDVEMQTIVNNVKDRNINRVPKDHEAAKNAVDKANKAVRDGIKNTTKIENTVPIDTFKAGKAATYNVDNITKFDDTVPVMNYNNNIKTMEIPDAPKTQVPEPPKVEPETIKANTEQPKQQVKSKSGKFDFGEYGNKAKDFFLGGAIDSYNNYQSGMGVIDSVVKAHQNADGSTNMMRAAGTFMTASAAARVVSGGGLYKDRYGNPNLIGVPFI